MKKILILIVLLSLTSCTSMEDVKDFWNPDRVYTRMANRKKEREQKIADEAVSYCTKLGLKDDGTLQSRWYSCVQRQAIANGYYNQNGRLD